MAEQQSWQDASYLRGAQYANSDRLAARANIHAKYGRGDWFAWLAEQPKWPGSGHVLEIGCGPGWLWPSARRSLAATVRLTLTDLSAGMVAEAVARVRGLEHWAHVDGRVVDAAELPFPAGCFDAVVASHMLYHLPDPSRGVAEIARVLAPTGLAIVATNGLGNMRELFDLQREVFGDAAGGDASRAFALENGRVMLEAVFKRVELRRYPDVLICTDPADILAYLTSSPPGDTASGVEVAALRNAIDRTFAAGGGTLKVTKDVGVFLCERPNV